MNEEIIERLSIINTWSRGDQRAPNKPLLIMLALSSLQRGKERLLNFNDVEKPLRRLLEKYGVKKKGPGPQYPYWRLQNDGIWEVPAAESLTRRKSNDDVPITVLREKNVRAGFKEEIYSALKKDPLAVNNITYELLNRYFPASLHEDIIEDTGISIELTTKNIRRDPAFRETVLDAYGWKCAVCGFDLHLSGSHFGVEAAHIKWHACSGPDIPQNGIAMCTMHHKSFDLGAFTIDMDKKIILSSKLHGGAAFNENYLMFHGKLIRTPISSDLSPSEEYLQWHRKEVFIEPELRL